MKKVPAWELLQGIKGEFVFSTSRRDSVALLFSFVGMKTKEVIWKGQRALDVVLEEDVLEVEEVVVNGYQPKKRSNMAGSASVIKAEELVFTGTNSLEQALQGKLPGVVIQSASGQVGTRQKVRVRVLPLCWEVKNQCGLWMELFRKIRYRLKLKS